MAKSQGSTSNMDVDYVVVFKYSPSDKQKAAQRLDNLLSRLATVGLKTEVRNGNDHTLLVFVQVDSQDHLNAEIYRSRARDWIHGVRASEPPKDTTAALKDDPLTPAERLRIIYQLITNPRNEGGAGITPTKGDWEDVENVFALHDRTYNQEWIRRWSTQWLLKPEDIDDIRNRFGEKIALYFAFTQSYFVFLTAPAAFGAAAWLLLGHFSAWYAVLASMWTVVFVEYWKHQERDLAVRWNVRGVRNIESRRLDFKPKFVTKDDLTGEEVGVFPVHDRLLRQLLQVPFVIAAVLALGSLIAACFAIEIFISELYFGPGKSLLTFLPTVLLTTGLPFLTGILGTAADKLTEFENYETHSSHEQSVTSKHFVLNFITSYLPISLTAFVYVPFGSIIIPYLDVFGLTVKSMAEGEKMDPRELPTSFTINPERLRKQVFYLTVTAQVVNFAMEVVVPYLKRRGFGMFKEMQSKRAGKSGSTVNVAADDHEEEKEFLTRVRNEAELDVYDVYDDLREMVVQYGYLAQFSVIWPLVPVSFLINNWIELRSDAVKICIEMQRPIPWRADTIGPWLDALSFISWLGSISMAALTYMFSNDGIGPDGNPSDIKGWGLLLAVFFSEHLYLIARWAVGTAISKIDSPGRQKARREMFERRRKHYRESLGQTEKFSLKDQTSPEITRTSLEEAARASSLKAATPEERFWARQLGWRESAQVGKSFIEKDVDEAKSASEKKEL